jgi:serine/threonine protein kinase
MNDCSWRQHPDSRKVDPPWASKNAVDDLRLFEACIESLMISLAEALCVLHSGGFSHNDLHEGNVLVSVREIHGKVEGRLGICDWGRASNVSEERRLSVLNKSGQNYIPPEHIAIAPCKGPKKYGEVLTPSTDVYAFGYLLKMVIRNRGCRGLQQWTRIADSCQARERGKRPSMLEVLNQLKAIAGK